MVRYFGFIITFDNFRGNSFFFDELDGRAEEVMKESPFIFVKVVEKRNDLGVIKAAIA